MTISRIQDVAGGQSIILSPGASFTYDEQFGKVLRLDSSHTYSTGGNPQLLKESNGFSVSVWINPDDNTRRVIVGREDDWYIAYGANSVTLTVKGTVLSVPVLTNRDYWSHLVVTFRPTGGDNYTGEVYVNRQLCGIFEEVEIIDVDSTKNLTLGGFEFVPGPRYAPESIGAHSLGWKTSGGDDFSDGDEIEINDDPTAYTDDTYAHYDDYTPTGIENPQFVWDTTGSAALPVGLQLRVVAKAVSIAPGTTSKFVGVYVVNEIGPNLAVWEGEIEIGDSPVLITVDLAVEAQSPYAGGPWQVLTVFETEGSSTAVLTVYDIDLIESLATYQGLLKDLRVYNRPLAFAEIEQINRYSERLYELPQSIYMSEALVAYEYTGSGELLLLGSSNFRIGYRDSEAGNGDLVLDGSSGFKIGYKYTGSGSFVLGGGAEYEADWFDGFVLFNGSNFRIRYRGTSSGGLVLGGGSEYEADWFDGFVLFDGSNFRIRYRGTSSGGLVLGGTSGFRIRYRDHGTGELVLSGVSPLRLKYRFTPSGQFLRLGGEAGVDVTRNILFLGGSSEFEIGYIGASSGSLVLSNGSNFKIGYRAISSGGLVLGGTSGFRIRYRDHGTGGLVLGGVSFIRASYPYIASGELVLSGQSLISQGLKYIASGELVLSGISPSLLGYDFEAGQTGNLRLYTRSDVEETEYFELEFTWNVNKLIEVELSFAWDCGDQILRYYQIEGECQKPPKCKITDVDLQDVKCSSGGARFIEIIAASSLSDLCRKLHEKFLNYPVRWPIASIRRFSRPVYTDQESLPVNEDYPDCDVWENQDYCYIPECFDLCLNEDLEVVHGIEPFIQDAFLYYTSVGGFRLDGMVIPRIDQGTTWTGGFEFSGSIHPVLNAYVYVGSGNLILDGRAEVQNSDWNFTADAEFELSGRAEVISENYTITPSGALALFGEVSAQTHLEWDIFQPLLYLEGINAPTRTNLKFGPLGSTLFLEGQAATAASYYAYIAIGELVVGGHAPVVSSAFSYFPDPEFALSGMAKIKRRHLAEGRFTLSGTNTAVQHMKSIASGEIQFGGEALIPESSGWTFTATGGFEFSGDAETNYQELGFLVVEFATITELTELQGVYPVIAEADNLNPDIGTVEANCGCDPMPLTLLFGHNLNEAAILKEFLIRNNLTLSKESNLIYNQFDNTWRYSYHYRGTGSESSSIEDWIILFEWGCVQQISEVELDGNLWKFSCLITRIKRKNNNSEKSETRIFYTIPVDPVCVENSIEYTFSINTQTGEIDLAPALRTEQELLIDEIGLFANRFWQKNPILKIYISQTQIPTETPTKNIKPIFPVS